jgi:hypothetical protein
LQLRTLHICLTGDLATVKTPSPIGLAIERRNGMENAGKDAERELQKISF